MFDAVEVAEANRKAAGADCGLATDVELGDAVGWVAVARAGLDAFEAHLLAELDVRGVCDREFGSPTLWWVTSQTRAPRAVVAARLRLGARLRFPLGLTDEALIEGRITSDHARVLADAAANPRIADDIAALQGELIDRAQSTNFRVWRHQMAVLVELLDQDGAFDPDRELARNHMNLRPHGDGSVSFSGELVGEAALSFTQLLEAETDRRWRAQRADHDECPELAVPDRSTLRALAMVDLMAKGSAGHAPTGHGPVVDVTLVIHADDPDQPDHVQTVDGDHVSPDTARHLCCDATFTPIYVDHNGVPLDAGREIRYANRAQRRALAVRDGGCVWLGCDMPVGWTDAHHITPWEHGGPTDLANLALLCRHHHGVTHRTGWTMTAHADQTFTWLTPGGQTLHSQRNRGSPGP
jgi:hypothetical protein